MCTADADAIVRHRADFPVDSGGRGGGVHDVARRCLSNLCREFPGTFDLVVREKGTDGLDLLAEFMTEEPDAGGLGVEQDHPRHLLPLRNVLGQCGSVNAADPVAEHRGNRLAMDFAGPVAYTVGAGGLWSTGGTRQLRLQEPVLRAYLRGKFHETRLAAGRPWKTHTENKLAGISAEDALPQCHSYYSATSVRIFQRKMMWLFSRTSLVRTKCSYPP